MIEKAKENIKLAGFENNITILEGDAEELLKEVEGPFDMIFMDAAKGQYKLFYDMVIDKNILSSNVIITNIRHNDCLKKARKSIVSAI